MNYIIGLFFGLLATCFFISIWNSFFPNLLALGSVVSVLLGMIVFGDFADKENI